MRRPVCLAAFALLLAVATAVLAHGLRVTVLADGDALRGQAFYADGSPAKGERVTLFAAPDGMAALAQTVTDADGRFRLPAEAGRSYRVVVDGDEGHRAEAMVVAGSGVKAGAAAASAELAGLIRAEVAPLREDLARLEARTRLADVIGGVGIIVGLVGLLAWWRARRRAAGGAGNATASTTET